MSVRWRVPLLAAGGLSLVAGLYSALMLLGFELPRPSLGDVHGPVMVLGFVGTLIALERAVALGTRWALLSPATSGVGALVLVLAGPVLIGKVLLAAGGVVLLGIYRALWRRQPSASLLAQTAGAFAWYAAAFLWAAGLTVPELLPWLATFVVATIAGERLELAHVAISGRTAERWFLACVAALFAGATAATLWPAGGYAFGAGLLAVVAWLVVFDVARRTIRSRGLPRYAAAGLLSGYAWLVLAGLLWAGGANAYDARVHAVFLGFTMSMIFVHAPVILPAVLRRPLPYRPVLYGPLVLLHVTLLLRVVVGDGLGMPSVWRWSGVGNIVAVVSFVALAVALGVTAARPQASARSRRGQLVGAAR